RHLQFSAQVLFFLAFICCFLHIIARQQAELGSYASILLLGSIVLPAFAGAFGAILHSGEVERIALRSGALKIRLETLAWKLRSMDETETSKTSDNLPN